VDHFFFLVFGHQTFFQGATAAQTPRATCGLRPSKIGRW
jgi:hypothetical protein